MTRVLVVDSADAMRAVVAEALRQTGFATREARTLREAEHAIEEFRPDLVVLEVALADGSGLELARRVRQDGRATPLIFLTERETTADKVAGLAVADDYITKPCSLTEVVARVRAVLRRAADASRGVLRFADIVLDETAHEVWRAGVQISLTPREFALLRYLMLNPRRVLTKQQILDNVWDSDFRGDSTAVETYVSYVRKKLDALGPPLIRTIRLVGYSLRDPDQ